MMKEVVLAAFRMDAANFAPVWRWLLAQSLLFAQSYTAPAGIRQASRREWRIHSAGRPHHSPLWTGIRLPGRVRSRLR